MSKESRVASLYRQEVFYPFVERIRKTMYDWEPCTESESVPDNLRVVSWMDGCYGQLKLITQEQFMKEHEDRLKITICKHSAARTGVEQAADQGVMFKGLKRLIKEMDTPHHSCSPIIKMIESTLDSMNAGGKLKLLAHKKKGIVSALAKLPIAMGRAYDSVFVTNAFVMNGMIEKQCGVVPSPKAMIDTLRGNIHNNVYTPRLLIENFYEKCFLNGMITEEDMSCISVPMDTNTKGEIVSKHNLGISNENRQRAKIITSEYQRELRKEFIQQEAQKEYQKLVVKYNKQEQLFSENTVCENKVIKIVKTKYVDLGESVSSLKDCDGYITSQLLTSTKEYEVPSVKELKASIKLRQQDLSYKNGCPSFNGLQGNKEDVIRVFLSSLNRSVMDRYMEEPQNPNII